MKLHLIGIPLLVTLLALAGCTPKESSVSPTPSLFAVKAPAEVFSAAAQPVTFEVTCDRSWSAKMFDGSWAALGHRVDGTGQESTIQVTLDLNLSEQERKDTLILTSGGIVKKVGFKQLGISSFVSATEIVLESGTPYKLKIEALEPWTLTPAEGEDWYTLSAKEGEAGSAEVTLIASDDNQNIGSRTGSVQLVCGASKLRIGLSQNQTDVILVSASAFTFDYLGGRFQVETQSNVEYTVEMPDADWLTPMETKALNEAVLSFEVARNNNFQPRTAEIVFRSGELSSKVTVSQGPGDAVLDEVTLGAYGLAGGVNKTYAEGIDQISRAYADGKLTFGILTPSAAEAWLIGGIPMTGLQAGLSFPAQYSVKEADGALAARNVQLTVLRAEGGKVWLKGADCPGLIIKL